MSFRRSGYLIISFLASGPLVACADAEIFDRVGPPSDAAVSDAPWPRLAETPSAPPLGVYTEAVPDPAEGEAVQIELSVAAETAESRRRAVEGPVE